MSPTDVDSLPAESPAEHASLGEEALVDLRRFRRRRWLTQLDWVDALYRAYLTAIVLGAAVVGLSVAASDERVSAATAAKVADRGPAWLGLGLAVAIAAGLRSGGRGGPLALEAAEVRHVLLAPIDRRRALRPPAFRVLRFAGFVGVVGGAIAGQYAYRRLPGGVAGWMVAGVVYGLLAVTGFVAGALVASGTRLGRFVVTAAAVIVVGWSVLDVALEVVTSPLSLAGGLGLWPLRVHAVDLVGLVPFVALTAAGWRWLGGISIERAERRSALVGQLRFAVTLQDVRTVVLLRRQLTQEYGRRRPLMRIGGLGRRPARLPTWRRSWQGFARWPTVRLVRLGAYGAGAGLALAGVWDGTTALLVPAGIALWLAGLDAIEPLAQDVDHPSLVDSYPKNAADLRIRQLGVPVVIMSVVGLIGCGAALVFGHPGLVLRVGLPTVIPAALAAVCGAAVSVVKGGMHSGASEIAMPELAGIKQVFSAALPTGLALLGGLPVLVARHVVGRDGSPWRGALAGCTIPLAASLGALVYLRMRERARAWWDHQMTMAAQGTSLRDSARREAEARVAARAGRSGRAHADGADGSDGADGADDD